MGGLLGHISASLGACRSRRRAAALFRLTKARRLRPAHDNSGSPDRSKERPLGVQICGGTDRPGLAHAAHVRAARKCPAARPAPFQRRRADKDMLTSGGALFGDADQRSPQIEPNDCLDQGAVEAADTHITPLFDRPIDCAGRTWRPRLGNIRFFGSVSAGPPSERSGL